MNTSMHYSSSLKSLFDQHRVEYPEPFRLRIHRALSWLNKAELSDDDLDVKFISLWISFNALYAREIEGQQLTESETFNYFFQNLCELDKDKAIYNLVWKKFSGAIRLLMDNPYVFQPFWEFHNGKMSEHAYLKAEKHHLSCFYYAVEEQKTANILALIFQRIYTLRNQLIHGGATYNSSANRTQVRDACAILGDIIPELLRIMLNNHQQIEWGKPFYPFIKTE